VHKSDVLVHAEAPTGGAEVSFPYDQALVLQFNGLARGGNRSAAAPPSTSGALVEEMMREVADDATRFRLPAASARGSRPESRAARD
jgi:hypothetical protein